MSIRMLSTRDTEKRVRGYCDVLLEGLAPDGGLYVPEVYPRVTRDELKGLKNASYTEIAFAIKKKLTGGEIPDEELKKFIDRAYAAPKFDVKNSEVTPVEAIGGNLHIQELSLGPTAAFKDMAMQLLGQEMEFELSRRGQALTILAATSGDTGSAAEAAFKGLERVKLFMLSPLEGMSDFQRAQMGALSGGNIFNISVRGRFDDCQDLVKKLKGEKEFESLGAVNSINWGRISSQVPYYFSGYLQAVTTVGDEVDFCVPSGNFGNVLSGHIAKRMGLPIRRLIVATNENSVLDTLFKTGVYAMSPAQMTSSPSMDISKASNYERLVYDIFAGDAEKVRAYMKEFDTTGRVDFASYGVSLEQLQALGFLSGASLHSKRLAEIKRVYEEAQRIIDPHTADAVSVARTHVSDLPMICMSTALPVKFEDTVREALGFIPPRSDRFKALGVVAADAFTVIDADAASLRAILVAQA